MANNLYSETYDKNEIELLDHIFVRQEKVVMLEPYPCMSTRINDIRLLKSALLSFESQLLSAMKQDFGHRSEDDAKFGDILTTVLSANHAIRHIKHWMRPSKRHVAMLFQPAKAQVFYQPLGVVGIITPWNYPVFLALGPLITALSAGNRAIIKMSEYTPATNKVMKQLITSVFSAYKVAVVDGGAEVAAHFSSLKFDHLIFTGSTAVGRKVMSSAAKNLTPVTLELGGKSPVIIDENIDIELAAQRFLLAKTLNSGQTCVAPDYVLCPEEKIPQLMDALQKKFNQMYNHISDNADYSAIINDAQYNRLLSLIDDAKKKGATVKSLNEENISQTQDTNIRKIPLTLITDINDEMSVMQEEIFGPLLPIIGYKNFQQTIDYINQRPKPLALYLMSFDKKTQQDVISQTKAGGVCINDAALHVAQDDLPFGGVGDSGMGHYHGHEGFLALSKAKPIFTRGRLNFSSMIAPPYGKKIHHIIYKLFIK